MDNNIKFTTATSHSGNLPLPEIIVDGKAVPNPEWKEWSKPTMAHVLLAHGVTPQLLFGVAIGMTIGGLARLLEYFVT